MRYLRNIKTGVVFQWTPILANHPDMIPHVPGNIAVTADMLQQPLETMSRVELLVYARDKYKKHFQPGTAKEEIVRELTEMDQRKTVTETARISSEGLGKLATPNDELSEMKIGDLRSMARHMDISLPRNATKPDYIAEIIARRNAETITLSKVEPADEYFKISPSQ